MASLNSLYIKAETLETLSKVLSKKKGKEAKGIELTIALSDEGNDYDQNVSAYVAQSKEDREEKKPRFYVGNGNTFWTDGEITVVKKQAKEEGQTASSDLDDDEDDLPF